MAVLPAEVLKSETDKGSLNLCCKSIDSAGYKIHKDTGWKKWSESYEVFYISQPCCNTKAVSSFSSHWTKPLVNPF